MNKNRTEQKGPEILKMMFDRMVDEPLPPAFLPEMMQRIREESVRIRKRDARRWKVALTAASLTIAGLAVAAFTYLDMPQFRVGFPRISIPPFYIHIGLLMLVLLFGDSWFRQKYFEKHPNG